MKLARLLSISLALAALATFAGFGTAWSADDKDHQAHHPAGVDSAAAGSKSTPVKPGADMGRMDKQMKTMQQMHDRMVAANTPEERTALMAEHMKTMQDGMSMMKGMPSTGMGSMKGDMSTSHQSMEKRMEMMQSMMQMMMDRMPAGPSR